MDENIKDLLQSWLDSVGWGEKVPDPETLSRCVKTQEAIQLLAAIDDDLHAENESLRDDLDDAKVEIRDLEHEISKLEREVDNLVEELELR